MLEKYLVPFFEDKHYLISLFSIDVTVIYTIITRQIILFVHFWLVTTQAWTHEYYIYVSRFNYQIYVFVYHLLGVVCVNVCLVHHDCTSIIAFQQYSYIHWSLRQQVKFLAMNNWAILTTWFSLREYGTDNKHAV